MTDSLLDHHDGLLLDLDGTVYRGGDAVSSAAETLAGAREAGVALRFVTNNASKSPAQVVDHLRALGLAAEPHEISTSAQAAAAMVAESVPPAAAVLVIGSAAFADEVAGVGLTPVRRFEDEPVAVVQGHSPTTGWADLAEACLALRFGALWIASNGDRTLPTERGELPGNGAMVDALRTASGREPEFAGKPQVPLLRRAVASSGAERPLMVGDRLDTDIAGAVAYGMPSLFVLTGVGTPRDVLTAASEQRPDRIGADVRAVTEPAAATEIRGSEAWTVRCAESVVELGSSTAQDDADPLAALRALCAAWWATGEGRVDVVGTDATAKSVLYELGLA
ncbi:HAD-IIA family hydrolase [Allosaccharopolyspora coralli]|uniref:HAD-IIA family hydrolase n=1 Tax=Allosaccharopolyspora coralli TaxID=2665642 RepID=A0A5Q3QBI6_9PSEU|nr:HAD-IIA family hydrolase [Allosaccharopolyspora coralli]QGK70584.1 HAD-IIA family hydrolase [Allosaccharopolyspora coralli]